MDNTDYTDLKSTDYTDNQWNHEIISVISDKGSILIGVLWSLFFLTALALVISASVAPQLALAGKLRDRAMLRFLAEAGMKRAVVAIRADETENYDALNEPWSSDEEAFKEIGLTAEGYFSLEYSLPAEEGEDIQKRYGLVDEERKINVNTASAGVLKYFFETAGSVSSQDAADIADAIADWRDGDDEPSPNGAESPYYEALDPGYPCKNGSFEIPEELLLVKGVTQEIFDKIKDRLTVYGEGKVNINTAGAAVLQSLGMSGGLVEKIVSFREGDDGREATADDNIFDDIQSAGAALAAQEGLSPEQAAELDAVVGAGLITVRSDYFRGRVVGGFRDREVSTEIVFVINRDEKILYWRED